jgi:hypothetical protein
MEAEKRWRSSSVEGIGGRQFWMRVAKEAKNPHCYTVARQRLIKISGCCDDLWIMEISDKNGTPWLWTCSRTTVGHVTEHRSETTVDRSETRHYIICHFRDYNWQVPLSSGDIYCVSGDSVCRWTKIGSDSAGYALYCCPMCQWNG